MVPKYPAARARINRNGSDSSGSEISCDTGNEHRKASPAVGGFRDIGIFVNTAEVEVTTWPTIGPHSIVYPSAQLTTAYRP